MKVTLFTHSKRCIDIDLRSDSIGVLRTKAHKTTGIPLDRLSITYNGVELEEYTTIEELSYRAVSYDDKFGFYYVSRGKRVRIRESYTLEDYGVYGCSVLCVNEKQDLSNDKYKMKSVSIRVPDGSVYDYECARGATMKQFKNTLLNDLGKTDL